MSEIMFAYYGELDVESLSQCLSCGAWVSDESKHSTWHKEIELMIGQLASLIKGEQK